MMEKDAAIVRVAWTPGRAEPDHRAEMVTEWLCGEALAVEEWADGGDWARVRGPDGYRSWVSTGGLLVTDGGHAGRWRELADRISLGVGLEARRGSSVPRWLPRGARVVLDEGRVLLPGGGSGRPGHEGKLPAVGELEERFPPRGDAVGATAVGWGGAPYLWGGRTPRGVDCSGLVQAVYRLHGVELPRDSGEQLAATSGARVAGAPASPEDAAGSPRGPSREDVEPGDLLFFGDSEDAVTHVAIALGRTRVVHAASGRGQVTEDDLATDSPFCRELVARRVAVTRPLAR